MNIDPRSGLFSRACVFGTALALFALLSAGPARAAVDIPVLPALNETIVFTKNNRLWPVDLEVTLFKPSGDGPFPVAVINHGKEDGNNNHFQARYRPLPAVRQLLQRGYAVVVPMRQGFSNSGGSVVGDSCNIAGAGISQAEDIRAVVSWLETQAWADRTRMLMFGQSHGGLTTLAYARTPDPGFKLFVNFAGGLKGSFDKCQWDISLKSAYAEYGAQTKVPTLWFYGANDSYFPPDIITPAYDAYVAAGGPAEMVAYGPFEGDAHNTFRSRRGLAVWWPTVEARMARAGLPTAIVHPEFANAGRLPVPPPSGYAAIGDVSKVPDLSATGRQGYAAFLKRLAPRAFAIGPNGGWGWQEGSDDPLRGAIENCQKKNAGAACTVYAVDNDVVWTSNAAAAH